MAVPKRKKSKSRAAFRINILKEKIKLFNLKNFIFLKTHKKTNLLNLNIKNNMYI
jgi:hypothetical protein